MRDTVEVSKAENFERSGSGDGSGAARATQDVEQVAARQPSACRATGPRTQAGKLASSKNALKFGIFSKELVLREAKWIPDETQENFERLLHSYVDHYGPDGPVEMHQIELAVGALWRYRRLLRAEAGEILRRKEFLDEFTPPRFEESLNERTGSIPGTKDSERLQRYEAHLLRIHYRALNELERLQRMRGGDAVPAPVVVDVQN